MRAFRVAACPSCFFTKILFMAIRRPPATETRFDMTKRAPTMPITRQCGNAARRRKKRRKTERRIEERVPEWFWRQAERASAKQTRK